MLDYASDFGAIVVSKDNFKDLYEEDDVYKEIIRKYIRCLYGGSDPHWATDSGNTLEVWSGKDIQTSFWRTWCQDPRGKCARCRSWVPFLGHRGGGK